ncbi:hypothetical protein BT63DRAFT_430143 [Microthyrium microscopicum]|uniref:Uncharacterized protein n=1 Tax=Microthyrium microscopicum TaxID=703497 RepID=A0A6A6TYZ6_9PEZI|nr:hypothetical protein BT63DRAFT_430143 [Microthyrium microscopicum]
MVVLNDRQKHERTGCLTTLILYSFKATPSELAILLAWPKILEHFTFEQLHTTDPIPYDVNWKLLMFEILLAPHRSTLQSISIGSTGAASLPVVGDAIDFSRSPELQKLGLSHRGWLCSPEQSNSTILTSKLYSFAWNFGGCDERSASWAEFGQVQADWLFSFAKLAYDQKSDPREIMIRFQLDHWSIPQSREKYEALGYLLPKGISRINLIRRTDQRK